MVIQITIQLDKFTFLHHIIQVWLDLQLEVDFVVSFISNLLHKRLKESPTVADVWSREKFTLEEPIASRVINSEYHEEIALLKGDFMAITIISLDLKTH